MVRYVPAFFSKSHSILTGAKMKKNLIRSFCIVLSIFIGTSLLTAGENLCPDPTMKSWQLPAEFVWKQWEGLNGQAAILVERTNPNTPVSILRIPVKNLKPGTRYEFGVWIKTENVQTGQGILGGQICTEFRNCNEHVEGAKYLVGVKGTTAWKMYSDMVITPASGFTHMNLLFMLGQNLRDKNSCTGKVWYSNPFVRELAPEWFVDQICPAMKYSLRPGQQELIFSSFPVGVEELNGFTVKAEIFSGDKCEFTKNVPVKDHRFVISPVLGKGDYTVRLTLTNGKISMTKTIALRVPDPAEKPGNAVWIDNRGRTWVDGKKFLPVCLYTNHFHPLAAKWGNRWNDADYDRLQKSPFNCVLSNGITRQRNGNWKGDGNFWARPTEENTKAALEFMDEFNRRGLKVIYAALPLHEKFNYEDVTGVDNVIKRLVERFSKHPALLAWYINDEKDVSENELKVRETFGKFDPWHPTYLIHLKYAYFAQFLGGGDIYGMDYYPIFNKNSDMKILTETLDAANKVFSFNGTLSCWAVPQIFAWNSFDKTHPFYFPKEEEMRATLILMSLSGVKGFVMYIFETIFDAEKPGDDAAIRWKAICNNAQMLRDLEPYLLSDFPAEKLKPEQRQGEVRATAFKAENGSRTVLIASINAGPAEAGIKIDNPGEFVSRYGRSKLDGNGVWIFRGKGIDGDVLIREEKLK